MCYREWRVGFDQFFAGSLVIGSVARDRDEFVQSKSSCCFADVHQSHDVCLVKCDRIGQRRLKANTSSGVHDGIDLFDATGLQKPIDVVDRSLQVTASERRGYSKQFVGWRRDIVGERLMASRFQPSHHVTAKETGAAGDEHIHTGMGKCCGSMSVIVITTASMRPWGPRICKVEKFCPLKGALRIVRRR